ncbi:tetratricopeptide repeat protein [uncultured Aquimarina sp.]|uniref:tetratricopeptide repeat protein n=1 Tax=uncultured Aquimarina sp. TaxID=575652 RepID=UPI0026296AF8|nr:tetratricopeptide repeat protein [uncultured Aquimarina sp.]
MEKLQKYFLSFVIASIVIACNSNLSEEEQQARADEMINSGNIILSPHFQGSPKMMTYVEEAIALDPESADAWRELSIPYLKRGMPNKWKPLFDKAVELDPEEWQGWRGYLYLYFYRNYKKAIEDFNATDILTPDFDDAPQGQSVNYMRGIAYLGLKDYTKSLSYFDAYINDQANSSGEQYAEVTAFLYRGIVYYQTNDFENAKKDFLKVLKYSGNHYADAHYYLAKCFWKERKKNEASVHIEKAIEDFNLGYFHSRGYVEVLYQIYSQDLEELNNLIKNNYL